MSIQATLLAIIPQLFLTTAFVYSIGNIHLNLQHNQIKQNVEILHFACIGFLLSYNLDFQMQTLNIWINTLFLRVIKPRLYEQKKLLCTPFFFYLHNEDNNKMAFPLELSNI